MVSNVIIRKERIKIRTAGEQYALQLRKQLTDSLQFDIITMMEKVFAQIETQNVFINIDKLKIDLGTITSKDFEQHFVRFVEEKLINELHKHTDLNFHQANITKDSGLQFTSDRQQNLTALLYFLEKGIYLWWYKEVMRQTPEHLLNNLKEDETQTLILKILSIKKRLSDGDVRKIISRLFTHFPETKKESLIYQLLALYTNTSLAANIKELIKNKDDLSRLYFISEKDFYKQLFYFLMLENTEAKANNIENFIIQLENVYESKVNRKQPDNPEEDEGIYISNAGLILLHPFLQPFFAEAGLLDDKNQFVSISAQQKATVLLYYLQTGNEEYKEWEMALNKIICGMQYDDLVPDGIAITEKEKEESRSLLQAVVNYWDALKGASVESMQNTFFLREGKITWKEEHWLLQVERTGFDILIERLPWGLGTIKFPWLQHLIFTEW